MRFVRLGWLESIVSLVFVLSAHASAPPDAAERRAVPAHELVRTNSSMKPAVIVIVGAAGEAEFGEDFRESGERWKGAAEKADASCVLIGTAADRTNDLQELRAALGAQPTNCAAELWLVLLGHGTWDGKEANFNLRGPDLSASELAGMLKPFSRPVAIINTGSASGPFIKALSRTNHVVITATRSGSEVNYARFGKYVSQSISSPDADLDKDGQTSLLEAYLFAARQVADFYKTEGRLATEHALLDDNGDGLGTPPDWFRGIRAVKTPSGGAAIDGLRAHQWHLIRSREEQTLSAEQRQRRDAIELRIAQLRLRKPQMKEDEYYQELERLLTELSPLVVNPEKGAIP